MGDLISRQAVQEMVDRIGGMYPYRQIGNRESYSQYNEAWTDAISRVDAELNSLPSARPERKTGKWLDAVLPNDNGGLPVQVCDQCNTFFPLAYTGGGHHFCPNCGADMRGEQDE